ncbi:hypothetical protein [Caulobacter sp. CCH9-E1]|jgi:hypothetical protein|uniref:hypothetical protein n=1 Tax=Caulobacter sp. CCH9-E1 TaxID=1768768 RepID=UPI00082E5A42|nr:hypothetical protein [Caulobacter sp. CCH9-E1]
MNKTFTRLKYIFLGLFLLSSAGVLAYHGLWVWPKQRCEDRGGAWAGKWMKCATVYPIETLTRRPTNVPPINGEAKLAPAAPAAQPQKK